MHLAANQLWCRRGMTAVAICADLVLATMAAANDAWQVRQAIQHRQVNNIQDTLCVPCHHMA